MSIFPVTDNVPFKPRYLWRNGALEPWQSATVHVSSIGHAFSHGCVRMLSPDVIDLYDRLSVGTPVYIGD